MATFGGSVEPEDLVEGTIQPEQSTPTDPEPEEDDADQEQQPQQPDRPRQGGYTPSPADVWNNPPPDQGQGPGQGGQEQDEQDEQDDDDTTIYQDMGGGQDGGSSQPDPDPDPDPFDSFASGSSGSQFTPVSSPNAAAAVEAAIESFEAASTGPQQPVFAATPEASAGVQAVIEAYRRGDATAEQVMAAIERYQGRGPRRRRDDVEEAWAAFHRGEITRAQLDAILVRAGLAPSTVKSGADQAEYQGNVTKDFKHGGYGEPVTAADYEPSYEVDESDLERGADADKATTGGTPSVTTEGARLDVSRGLAEERMARFEEAEHLRQAEEAEHLRAEEASGSGGRTWRRYSPIPRPPKMSARSRTKPPQLRRPSGNRTSTPFSPTRPRERTSERRYKRPTSSGNRTSTPFSPTRPRERTLRPRRGKPSSRSRRTSASSTPTPAWPRTSPKTGSGRRSGR